IHEILEKIPVDRFGVKHSRVELKRLINLLAGPRNPAIVLIGRSGAGKSSLINALFSGYVAEVSEVTPGTGVTSTSEWQTYYLPDEKEKIGFDVLDTRGAGDIESGLLENDEGPQEVIKKQLENKLADIVLFVAPASNLRNNMESDCKFLNMVLNIFTDDFHYQPPIVPILNQADEVLSPDCNLPPDDEEDMEILDDSMKFFNEILDNHNVKKRPDGSWFHTQQLFERIFGEDPDKKRDIKEPIPVCSYIEFRKIKDKMGNFKVAVPNEILSDLRWNIDTLAETLVSLLPVDAAVATARISQIKSVQKDLIKKITLTCCGIASLVSAIPLLVADSMSVAGVQLLMVYCIAKISGKARSFNELSVEFLSVIGIEVLQNFGVKELIKKFIKKNPIGIAAGAATTFGITKAMALAAEAYYLDEVSKEEARKIFEGEKNVDPETREDYKPFKEQELKEAEA
ncbi:GTPase, partial [Candidatus Riflebacteria bacterium]